MVRVDKPRTHPGDDELVERVSACGACRTDLHVTEGDLPVHRVGVTAGNETVGELVDVGRRVADFAFGDRVGVARLRHTCGEGRYCRTFGARVHVLTRTTDARRLPLVWDWTGGRRLRRTPREARRRDTFRPTLLISYRSPCERWLAVGFSLLPGSTDFVVQVVGVDPCVRLIAARARSPNLKSIDGSEMVGFCRNKSETAPSRSGSSTSTGPPPATYVFDRAALISGSPATFQYFQTGAGTGVSSSEQSSPAYPTPAGCCTATASHPRRMHSRSASSAPDSPGPPAAHRSTPPAGRQLGVAGPPGETTIIEEGH